MVRVFNSSIFEKLVVTQTDTLEDATIKLQSLLNTGRSLKLTRAYMVTNLTFTVDNQKIEGGTLISLDCTKPILSINARSGCIVRSTSFVAQSHKNSVALHISQSINIKIEKIDVSSYGRAGILLTNVSNCTISSCSFRKAVSNDQFGASSAVDIDLSGSNTHCTIVGNNCRSNGGYGIQIRTNQNGEHSDKHIVSNNVISGYNSYGILLYRNSQNRKDVDSQSVSGCVVSGNVISQISGGRASDPTKPRELIFGAGIYIQGAEGSLLTNNRITETCLQTNNELLAPGSIGLANVGSAEIRQNYLSKSEMVGIYVNDANGFGLREGRILLIGNSISSAKHSGVKVMHRNNVIVSHNSIRYSNYGIILKSSRANPISKLALTSNNIFDCHESGITVDGGTGITISKNQVQKCGLHGISVGQTSDIALQKNIVSDIGGRGFEIRSTCEGNIILSGNSAKYCSVGFLIDAQIKASSNQHSFNKKDWLGQGKEK